MTSRLAFAMQTAYEAGRQTLAHFNTRVAVEYKENDTPVTRADRDAEHLIRLAIAEHYPGEAIFGEEEGGDTTAANRWIIDPIDGTKSFVSGVPLFGTLLSYEQDGIPVVGVAYFAALDEMVAAERGGGAQWNGRPCRVSRKTHLREAVLSSAGHKSMAAYGYADALNRLATKCLATRTWSDAYGHALVATGRVEAMIDPVLEPYDVSAISLIVQEAGGKCTSFLGEAWPRTEALSSNGVLHERLLAEFAR